MKRFKIVSTLPSLSSYLKILQRSVSHLLNWPLHFWLDLFRRIHIALCGERRFRPCLSFSCYCLLYRIYLQNSRAEAVGERFTQPSRRPPPIILWAFVCYINLGTQIRLLTNQPGRSCCSICPSKNTLRVESFKLYNGTRITSVGTGGTLRTPFQKRGMTSGRAIWSRWSRRLNDEKLDSVRNVCQFYTQCQRIASCSFKKLFLISYTSKDVFVSSFDIIVAVCLPSHTMMSFFFS